MPIYVQLCTCTLYSKQGPRADLPQEKDCQPILTIINLPVSISPFVFLFYLISSLIVIVVERSFWKIPMLFVYLIAVGSTPAHPVIQDQLGFCLTEIRKTMTQVHSAGSCHRWNLTRSPWIVTPYTCITASIEPADRSSRYNLLRCRSDNQDLHTQVCVSYSMKGADTLMHLPASGVVVYDFGTQDVCTHCHQ